ncbi:helix-turn-helix transcriptional regulator [Corallococcus exiguus]|uniref:helix-turn-helix domain-containing protein n=1 Tax=Corallococcus TaxID=83461 RepID=UPI000EEB1ADF|nr:MULTISPECIES: AraC family transcriptional regulator [Corallococcus]NNB84424.1 helix-turn-helix transcriptional regulator [Corallococcus exiguus]NNB92705.1 helix-turn-helix transcriptional regulator [Corallococcus exiguus]NNC01734.1 helix-turn-helix transcriptional regulator [Corallococcus exiguus]NPC45524.1 helix-turn-helix transcriptional regulator [Corallococcus exiguus]RKH84681.1 AraC family transcriptional regulator [Corallococcus sp. AB032C]
MSPRHALLAQIGADIVRFQEASAEFDSAVGEVLALGRAELTCLAQLHFGGPAPLSAVARGADVERLELAGYVQREGAGSSRRLTLTGHAREWIETLWGPVQADGLQLMAPMPDAELKVIARFLGEARKSQDRHSARVAKLLQEPGGTRAARRRGGLSAAALHRVRLFIEAHLARRIQVGELARRAGLSVFYFTRAFRQSMGMTPHAYVQQRRVERARGLLSHTTRSLGDIALAVGFSSQSHFTTVFRRVTGLTPAVLRRAGR